MKKTMFAILAVVLMLSLLPALSRQAAATAVSQTDIIQESAPEEETASSEPTVQTDEAAQENSYIQEAATKTILRHLYITMTRDLYTGMKPEEITVTVPDDANYTVKSHTVWDLTNDAECVSLQPGCEYQLRVTVVPNSDYYLYSNFEAYCNYFVMGTACYEAGAYGECSFDFTLDGGDVYLTKLPDDINAGNSVSTPSVATNKYQIKAYKVAWLDADRQPVPTKVNGQTNFFQSGNLYYLSFELVAEGPFGAWEDPRIHAGEREVIVEVVDARHAMVYIPYVPNDPIYAIRVSTQGIAVGKPISEITATIEGNATLNYIKVHDNGVGHTVTEGVFQSNTVYVIEINVSAAEGYFISGNVVVTVDGVEEDWYSHADGISFTTSLNTNQEIKSVKLSISGVSVGKSISAVKLKEASGSHFWIDDIDWSTTASSGTKFQKGHRYYLSFQLYADQNYYFSENTTVTVGGKEVSDISIYCHGEELWGAIEYSFMTEITKVSLPAMPKSVKLGSTLPDKFKVSSSAKYTLETVWLAMSTQETVTKATEEDCYVLAYVAVAKDGCEFTEDTVVYVDGKKVTPIVMSSYYVQVMKPYNVGLTEIKRVDLTVPEPEHGAIPGEATVAADAPYVLNEQGWGVNSTGKLKDGAQSVVTFQNYKYHFLAVGLQAKEGYAFASSVSVYINGIKYTTLEDINLGTLYQTAVSFGKLGEIPKLTAPKLTKDGEALSWEAVKNADQYEIYRATKKSGKYTKVATVAETTWQDSVAAGKTYYYKIKAIFTPDTGKNSGYSNVVSVAYKCDAPVISVENGSSGKPVISWEKVSGAKQYTVYRATSVDGKYTKLDTTKKLSYTDSKATSGNEYFYKVIANGSSSTYNSGYSNIYSCYVICGTPSVTAKVDAATGKPSLTWKKVTGAAEYRIYRQLPGEEDFAVLTEQTGTSFLDTTAPIDTVCSYKVQALGEHEMLDGAWSKVVTVTSAIARPKLQSGINAQGKPQLDWEPVEGAVKYEIYRSTKSSKSYKLLETVEDGNTYEDATVAPGKTYYYKAVAIGVNSKSAQSSYVKLTGKCATPEIKVEAGENGKPVISWEKVSGAKQYTVYRATSETGKYSKLDTITKLSYTDSKATVGTEYFYKVIANGSKSAYNSGYSNAASCLTVCAAPAVTAKADAATGAPALSWKKVTGAAGYEIYRSENGGEYTLVATQDGVTYKDPDAQIGSAYSYQVKAIAATEGCDSVCSAEKTVTATCAQPKIKGKVGDARKPEITWEEVEGATKYVIYRSTSKSKGYKAIRETEELTFTDTTAKKGKTYYYKVVAISGETQSAQSSYVKVKSK